MKELSRTSLLPENILKKSLRFAAKAVPISLTTSFIIAACGGEQTTTNESQSPSNPESLPPSAALNMPFPKDSKMQIQQGWRSSFDPNHNGIDYIKGELDNSRTWKSFPVLVAADGLACANPPSRQGEAVLVTHSVDDNLFGSTYYGHLKRIEGDIPECDSKTPPKLKKQGEKLGDSGATGARDQAWIHLHFQVNDANGNFIDPYGLQKERDIYPDPNFKNGKPCGPKALFKDCFSKGAVVAGPKDPIPPISATVEAPKSTLPAKSEGKISISKSPEDLYRTLASAPLTKDLPSGMSVIGGPTAVSSSVRSNEIAKSFGKPLQPFSGGTIFITIDDQRSNPVKGQGYPNVSLSFNVFASNQDTQDAYNKIVAQNEQTRPIKNFPYVAIIQGPTYSMYSGASHIENVVVGFTVRGNDMKVVEQRAIDLMRAMPKLLQNAGN